MRIDDSPHECWRDWRSVGQNRRCAESTQMSINLAEVDIRVEMKNCRLQPSR